MTDSDLAAIATYLKSVPGSRQSHAVRADDPSMVADRRSIATNVQPATPWMGMASRNSFRRSPTLQ